MQQRKLFAGAKIRNLRQQQKLTQKELAERLDISPSYLNQLENNQRPVTAAVILALVDHFQLDIASFASDESDRIVADLREALVDPVFAERAPSLQEIKIATSNTPDFAHAFLALHRAYQRMKERLANIDDTLQREDRDLAPLPYEEVRDFFHYKDNYIDWLDRGAEAFFDDAGLGELDPLSSLTQRLNDRHGIRIIQELGQTEGGMLSKLDSQANTLSLNANLPKASQIFQILQHIAYLEEADAIEQILDEGRFRTHEARSIAKIGLANYFAGAAILPYSRFLEAARTLRHDIERLAHQFGASIEQVAHRLSTLQRSGARGVPFFFVRVDQAGTITKRHSATRLQFARFGGACPLWNVHRAFEQPGRILRQLAETPDGERYFCLARSITKRGIGYRAPIRRYAIGLGCPISFAGDLVYSDDLDLARDALFEPIGISCRICERQNCLQRAVPPVGRAIQVNTEARNIVPFELGE